MAGRSLLDVLNLTMYAGRIIKTCCVSKQSSGCVRGCVDLPICGGKGTIGNLHQWFQPITC